MSIFTSQDYWHLHTLFDGVREHGNALVDARTPYPGYRPEVIEAPNGDTKECPACGGAAPFAYDRCCRACRRTGRVPNVDAQKRYLHVALKYNPPAWAEAYLARAHWHACRVAEALGVPAAYYPRAADGTLRVLEYPAGAGSAEHTDFDLFTIVCYRSTPEDLEFGRNGDVNDGGILHVGKRAASAALAIDPHLHIGEIGALVGLGPATPHRVPARPYVQRSIVYFAMPDHAARLPPRTHRFDGSSCVGCYGPGLGCLPTVGQWLKERIARSRVYK